MPILSTHAPALPECLGNQWTISNINALAEVVALVLIGRAFHAAEILEGTQESGAVPGIHPGLKEKLRQELHPQSDPAIWHRDGLLFEIINWVVAKLSSTADEAVTDPHLKSTNQGTDCIKVKIDPAARTLSRATVYECKCTTNWRRLFSSDVLDAFQEYVDGKRDHQLSQASIALLTILGFTSNERKAAYDYLVQDRPLAFEASLTVSPANFSAAQRLGLFGGFDVIAGVVDNRIGNTLPLNDIRAWFVEFSKLVWSEIEGFDV